jgi:DNA polymerase III alpha subunit
MNLAGRGPHSFGNASSYSAVLEKRTVRGQGLLLPPPGMDRLPEVPLQEPTRRERLEAENELLGFPASGHPLELHRTLPGIRIARCRGWGSMSARKW